MATYEKTLQTAFREVANAPAVRGSLGERLAAQQSLIALKLAEQSNRITLFKALGGGWRDGAASS